MCGIAGMARFGKAPIRINEARDILLRLESRGSDATGLAVVCDKRVNVAKAPLAAQKFVDSSLWSGFATSKLEKADAVLLHTRAATHGSPNNNKNNHPIIGDRGIIVHNGIVFSPKTKTYHADGETDTEQLLRSIEEKGLRKALAASVGAMAIAFIWIKNPERIYLYSSGMPLSLAMDFRRQQVYFASTWAIMQPTIGDLATFELEHNRLYVIDRQKQQVHGLSHIKGEANYALYQRQYGGSLYDW